MWRVRDGDKKKELKWSRKSREKEIRKKKDDKRNCRINIGICNVL